MTLHPVLIQASRLLLMILATGVAGAATAPRHPSGVHLPGVARLTIAAAGSGVVVELTGPAVTLIGFEHAPVTADERATLRLAKENLKTGDAMIRFNTNAGCRLIAARVDAHLTDNRHGNSRSHGDGGQSDMTASYRFNCDQPERLDSAALGLFSGFPALQRVLVQYVTADGQGEAELTPTHPLVTFVPLGFR